MKISGVPPAELAELTRAQDRVSFLYLERCVIHRDSNAITAADDKGVVHIPAATLGVLLLGLIFNELNFERGKGIFDLTQYWEEVIRGLFLLIVIILQSRLANTSRVTRSM